MGRAGKDMSDIYHKIKEGRGVPRGIDGADWFWLGVALSCTECTETHRKR